MATHLEGGEKELQSQGLGSVALSGGTLEAPPGDEPT